MSDPPCPTCKRPRPTPQEILIPERAREKCWDAGSPERKDARWCTYLLKLEALADALRACEEDRRRLRDAYEATIAAFRALDEDEK